MAIDWFPLWLSLRVASFATVISLAISLPLAWLLATRQWRGKELLDAVTTLPLVLPPTVLGYYLLVVIGRQSITGRVYEWIFGGPLIFSWQAAVVAALFHSTPLLIKFTRAAFESIDPSFERAARNLGASEWKVFWRVTVPLARRSIYATAAMAFARSLGDFGITIMIAGNIPGRTQTMAVAIYDAVESGNGALARTLVVAMSLVAIGILYLTSRLEKSRLERRESAA
jgi:molybdate transport system permease protein